MQGHEPLRISWAERCRLSIYQVEARYKERLVWEIERRLPGAANSRSYYAAGYSPEPGEVIPD